MPKNITVFTRPTCAPCRSLKAYFKNKGITYQEVNVDEEPEATARMIELGGRTMVPMTLITNQDNTQQVISGYNISKIVSALN